MIDPNELRIGNYIQPKEGKDWWGYKFKSIQYIGHDGEFARESDMGQCDVVWNIKDADPIPITPEWLERLGFEKRESSTCIEYHIGINDVTHDWLFSLTWLLRPELIKAPDYPFYMNGRHTLFYVHQVQNLYFALTGQELTVKL